LCFTWDQAVFISVPFNFHDQQLYLCVSIVATNGSLKIGNTDFDIYVQQGGKKNTKTEQNGTQPYRAAISEPMKEEA
jgi:hypothetical protein